MKLIKHAILSSITILLFMLFAFRFVVSVNMTNTIIAFVVAVILFSTFLYNILILLGTTIGIATAATNIETKVSRISKEDLEKIFKNIEEDK